MWKLQKALYGLKAAPRLWQLHLQKILKEIGWKQCHSDRTIYLAPDGRGVMAVYVADLLVTGEPSVIDGMFDQLMKKNLTLKKSEFIEAGQSFKFLGIDISRTSKGFKLDTSNYCNKILDAARMSTCNPVATPKETKARELDTKRRKKQDLQALYLQQVQGSTKGWCEDHNRWENAEGTCDKCMSEWEARQANEDAQGEEQADVQPQGGTVMDYKKSKLLDSTDHSRYRTIVGQLMWVCSIRGDLAYSIKELARRVSAPTVEDWKSMQRVLRYLRGVSCLALHMEPKPGLPANEVRIVAYSDSDWAGCLQTRRSTSGGVLTLDHATVGHWSRTQAVVALSSGEAEYYALSHAAVECTYLKHLLSELGYTAVSEVRSQPRAWLWADLHRHVRSTSIFDTTTFAI